MTSSKLQPCLLKQTLKTQKNLKELEIMRSISVFLDIANLLISGEKMLISAEIKGCAT